jgi:DNA modification methylase
MIDIRVGNCLDKLKEIPDDIIDSCITSPPYYGLRDYQTATWEGGDLNCDHKGKPFATKKNVNKNTGGRDVKNIEDREFFKDICRKCGAKRKDDQIGLEQTPDAYVEKLVQVFREVRRVLKPTGNLWLNLGDSFSGSRGNRGNDIKEDIAWKRKGTTPDKRPTASVVGLKPKDLIGIPWMVAFALRADGWWLRQDIIWQKSNPMPESVTDRCTKSHEYIFLLAKSQKYYFDHKAIREQGSADQIPRLMRGVSETHKNVDGAPGQTPHSMNKPRKNFKKEMGGGGTSFINHSGYYKADGTLISDGMRNKRDVWIISTKPFKEAHFATFSKELILPCVLAGCPKDGTILDPFMGSGTTGVVAKENNRNFIGVELNPAYAEMARKRIDNAISNSLLDFIK